MSAVPPSRRVVRQLTSALILLAALVALTLALVPAAARAGSRHPTGPVSSGFVGMDVAPPVYGLDDSPDFQEQIDGMVAAGVQRIRIAFNWAAQEPYPSWSQVPAADAGQFTDVAGKPYDFSDTDTWVADAAERGVSVFPTVLYAPSWDASRNRNGVATPRVDGPYGTYLTALIDRYGPNGTFWSENPQIPRVPIRSWQIWNEENLAYYWHQPFASSYVGLLRVAHAAIKRADPGAQVVLGALTNMAWISLGQIYRVRGAARQFDAVSVNAFTKLPADVILYLRYVRNAMHRFHDGGTPLLATELSWPSATGQHTGQRFDFDTTQAGQAHNIATLLPLLGRDRWSLRLAGFFYDTWMGNEADHSLAFNFAGLLRFVHGQVTAKPALQAFRSAALRLEGCSSKGELVSSCIQ